MSEWSGYAGNILKIDLTRETATASSWSDQERERYLGGKTMAAKLMGELLSGGERALSEENCIVITTGPLTGTGAPGSARFDIAFLSPKDGLPAFSNCGGNFGIRLKRAGYDGLILTGRCREKRWMEIREDGVIFHDAGALWGTGTAACREMLGAENSAVLCIGPAGENLVKFASVLADGHSTGRAGLGAVLGYKNLKAITVDGSRETPLYAPEKAAAWNREWHADLHAKASARSGASCNGCPLRCPKQEPSSQEALLNDLGMDAIAAGDAAAWAAEQGISLAGVYEAIACRRGIGDTLAEGVPHRKGKGGKRRDGSYEAIMEAFGLNPNDPEAETFCKAFAESVSAAGQCMFTVNGLRRDEPAIPVLKMLEYVTGMEMPLDTFLQIGMRFLELEQQLRRTFGK